jgi:hypothetical protein
MHENRCYRNLNGAIELRLSGEKTSANKRPPNHAHNQRLGSAHSFIYTSI